MTTCQYVGEGWVVGKGLRGKNLPDRRGEWERGTGTGRPAEGRQGHGLSTSWENAARGTGAGVQSRGRGNASKTFRSADACDKA
jgi:hypothetical protein